MGVVDQQQPQWLQKMDAYLSQKLEGYSASRVATVMSGICVALAITFGTIWILVVNAAWDAAFGQKEVIGLAPAYIVICVTTVPIAYPMYLLITTMIQLTQRTRRELARTAAEAEEASRMKSSFLASTSHEIRTPLNGIVGMVQLLSRSKLNAEQREHVKLLSEASHSLSRLLGDILDISKVEAGRMSLAPAPTDFRAIVEANASLWSATAYEKGLQLTCSIDEATPRWLTCDGERIRQCIANLTSNAMKFTDNGSIEIRVESREAEDGAYLVAVRVSDTGPGIEEDDLERIFEAFEQIGAMEKRRAGTGLGLAISRNLARIMGGDITIRSTPGFGSDFIFTFRAEPCEAPEERKAASQSALASGLRLLVTDDNATNRTVAQLLLRSAGQEAVTTESGAKTLELLAEQPFDIVLLDMHMPEMDGPETLRRIRASGEAWSDVKVIALTADAMTGDRDKYLAIGMDGYAVKPIDLDALLAEIARVHAAPALAVA